METLFEEVTKAILGRRRVAFRKSCDVSAKYDDKKKVEMVINITFHLQIGPDGGKHGKRGDIDTNRGEQGPSSKWSFSNTEQIFYKEKNKDKKRKQCRTNK